MYAFVYIGTFYLSREEVVWIFTVVIPASEFKDFQLKVASLAPIKVSVIGHDDEAVGGIPNKCFHSMYGFKTKNEEIKEVKCEK